jgi:hypothetical protein
MGGAEKVELDPRAEESYWLALQKVWGFGVHLDAERYKHLCPADRDLLTEGMRRCRSAFWIENTPRTVLRCFRHDVETVGAPVRQPPYRLKGPEQDALEACVRDDLKSGQLVRGDGSEEWTSPAFVVRYPKVRMVVDYRRVNARTRRSVFILPRGDDQKAAVAPAHLVSMLDAVSGFNHLPNTHRARKVLAMVTLSGIYQPLNLPFGPLNGPEDFQKVMHSIFGRRLWSGWYVYLDDLAVATMRRAKAAEAAASRRGQTAGEKAAAGLSRAAGSGVFPQPIAHAGQIALIFILVGFEFVREIAAGFRTGAAAFLEILVGFDVVREIAAGARLGAAVFLGYFR